MKVKELVFASFLALTLVACGPGDDQAKKGGKGKIPAKTKECVEAGELCKFENNRWVVHKKPGGGKDDPDPAPVAETAFDYSDIGVTDNLAPERKGFGFYHKGPKSPLDAKLFKNVTLSPSISWSSTREYDKALYNFVAIKLGDKREKKEKNPIKFMFDKIGEVNQAENENFKFFGGGLNDKNYDFNDSSKFAEGASSISTDPNVTYKWNYVPALVNTFMFRNAEGKWDYEFADKNKKLFYNQEEESGKGTIGSGAKKLRVYGVNAFLSTKDDAKQHYEKVILSDTTSQGKAGIAESDLVNLPGRGKYYRTVNFAWYNLGNLSQRKQKAVFKVDDTDKTKVKFQTALDAYKYDAASKTRAVFPTDIDLDTLESVQFGRLTGQGVDPSAPDISGYGMRNLKEYPFTTGKAATAGNQEGEDWYFSRGTQATPIERLESYKKAGRKITYDGQAVMFGLDYRPTSAVKKKPGKKPEQSTNSVKPADPRDTLVKTPLDGKQNFVRMEWDAGTGEIVGRVYGVWTLATYWRRVEAKGGEKLFTFSKVKTPGSGGTEPVYEDDALVSGDLVFLDADKASDFVANYAKNSGSFKDAKNTAAGDVAFAARDVKTQADAEKIAHSAFKLEPWFVTLVALKGQIKEGTNAFSGEALRMKDDSKGLFVGGFFGPDGMEIGGVINSQMGNMKNKDLADPNDKWGGAFGAKHMGTVIEEDLIFTDAPRSYMTSVEFWNK